MSSHRVGLIAALALLAVTVPPAASASPSLWTSRIATAPSVLRGMALGADGSHHVIFATDGATYTGSYATDRGGAWRIQSLPVEPLAIVMDASDDPVVLGIDSLHHEIYRGDGTTDLAKIQVPDGGAGRNSDVKATADGLVHVAWSDGVSAYYATLGDTTWSDVTTLHPAGMPQVNRLALAIDGDHAAHVIVSGIEGDVCPAGGCVSDIAVTGTPTATDVGVPAGFVWATTGPSGLVDVAALSFGVLRHASNASGGWASEVVATGIGSAFVSSAVSGGSLVLFLTTASGAQRADWSGGTWHLTTLHAATDAAGAIDAQGVPHVAYAAYPAGSSALTTYLLAPDATPPVAAAPTVRPRVGGIVGSTAVPMTISWGGTDNLSGWSTSTVQQQSDGGAWSTIGQGLTAKSLKRSLAPGTTKYAFRVRGTDKAGNVGGFAAGPTVTVRVTQQTSTIIKYGGRWHSTSSSSYLGGTAKYATSTSASATISFTGRAFAWVGAEGGTRGSAKVWVDGVLVKTVRTYHASTLVRRVLWAISWATSGTHTIVIRPAGTSGHPRIDLDAIVLVK